jgi:tricorn protease
MKRSALIVSVFLSLSAAAFTAASDEAVLARYPAPSPDGSQIAFSYQGDIWVVPAEGGRALRLTVHEAYDYMPRWSPDGREIAFSSDRFGNDDVFVIPAGGGEAERLTFMSADDVVCDWTPDGKAILFSSRRDWRAHRVPVIYQVPRTGGTPTVFMPEFGNEGAVSPDGSRLAFTTGYRNYWWRKNYRGAGNNDILIWNRKTGEYRKLTDHPGNDAHPMWSGDGAALFYMTDASGSDNIWRVDIDSGEKNPLTAQDGRLRYPSISADGSLIAYEYEADIYILKTDGSEPSRLQIVAPSDSKFNTVERLTFSRDADEMEPSPDNEEIAFVVRGELFVMKEKGDSANQLTEDPARDFDIIWKPDGTAVVFRSDKTGNYDLYMIESDDPEEKLLSRALAFKITPLTSDPADEHTPRFSPDGKKLAFVLGNADLHILDMETKEDKLLLAGWSLDTFTWSPDGQWIALSRDDAEFNSDIWIVPAAGGDPVNITQHPDADTNPVWSPDGRKLAFISKHSNDRGAGDNLDVYMVFLRIEDDEKTAEDWELEEAKKDKKPEKKDEAAEKKEGEEKKEEKPKVEVKIDFEDIQLRIRQVTSQIGDKRALAFSPDSKTIAFTSDNTGDWELWNIKWDGTEQKQLTSGGANPSSVCWSKDGKKIYYLRRGGMIQSIAAGGGAPTGHSFQARMTIDHPAERRQKYEEAWRVLNDRFYDPNFHGADWATAREKYRPWAIAAVETRDFNTVVNMMFGELDASHMGIGGPSGDGPQESTGMLGLVFDESYSGPGLRVASVLKDGPCDKTASKVNAGEYILAIDGEEVSLVVNIHKLLVETTGRKVVLTVAASPEAQEKRRVIVRPASTGDISRLLYEEAVRQRREMAHRLSDGRIGYLHVQAMGQPYLERFERELFSEAHGKEAVVIDVRNNGGGWTTDMMLAMLQVKPHAYTIPRNGPRGYPISERLPLYAYWKPIVTMCNEYSYSNAEIFSWAIKTLKRGLVVGRQTNGAVISTGGYGLIDGSFIRTPGRGWYVYGTDIDQERNGCPPDIVVEVQPGDEAAGIDSQLERAVQELLKQLD